MKNGAMGQRQSAIDNMRRRNKRITTMQSHRTGQCRSIKHVQRISIEPILFPVAIDSIVISDPFSLVVVSDWVLGLGGNHVEFVEEISSSLFTWKLE